MFGFLRSKGRVMITATLLVVAGMTWALQQNVRSPGFLRAQTTTCGNGVLEFLEQCDDGNTNGNDGCNHGCQLELGWTCAGTPSVCTRTFQPLSVTLTTPRVATVNGQRMLTITLTLTNPNTVASTQTWVQITQPSFTAFSATGSPECEDVNSLRMNCPRGSGAANLTIAAGQSRSFNLGFTVLEENNLCTTQRVLPVAIYSSNMAPSSTNASDCPMVICGNGSLESGEQCDDQNMTNGDGCSAACAVETGWTCSGSPSVCTSAGGTAVCANGIVEGTETCDDGNTTNGDGCSSLCVRESGWTCSGHAPSVCYRIPVCGNGQLESGEGCDDGNTVSGDGCSPPQCTVNTGWTCTWTSPSVCTRSASSSSSAATDPMAWTAIGDMKRGTLNVEGLAYGAGKFVAVGYDGKSSYSVNGSTWTTIVDMALGTSDVYAVAYGNGKFVAGGTGGKGSYSSDGITWAAITDMKFGTSSVTSVTYGNGKFVAVGRNGKGAYSSDGITWTAIGDMKFAGGDISAVSYGNGKFVAVGLNNKGAYSADGITWTAIGDMMFRGQNTNGISDVLSANGKFVAVGQGGQGATSLDGINWTTVSDMRFGVSPITSVAYGNGKFVAAGYNGKGATSLDGVTWAAISDMKFGGADIRALAYGNGQFVAGGDLGRGSYSGTAGPISSSAASSSTGVSSSAASSPLQIALTVNPRVNPAVNGSLLFTATATVTNVSQGTLPVVSANFSIAATPFRFEPTLSGDDCVATGREAGWDHGADCTLVDASHQYQSLPAGQTATFIAVFSTSVPVPFTIIAEAEPSPGASALEGPRAQWQWKCGDGNLDTGEQCDGASHTCSAGLTCSLLCQCPQATSSSSSHSSSSSLVPQSSSSSSSQPSSASSSGPLCGNGVLDSGEQCDDTASADCSSPGTACSAQCRCEACAAAQPTVFTDTLSPVVPEIVPLDNGRALLAYFDEGYGIRRGFARIVTVQGSTAVLGEPVQFYPPAAGNWQAAILSTDAGAPALIASPLGASRVLIAYPTRNPDGTSNAVAYASIIATVTGNSIVFSSSPSPISSEDVPIAIENGQELHIVYSSNPGDMTKYIADEATWNGVILTVRGGRVMAFLQRILAYILGDSDTLFLTACPNGQSHPTGMDCVTADLLTQDYDAAKFVDRGGGRFQLLLHEEDRGHFESGWFAVAVTVTPPGSNGKPGLTRGAFVDLSSVPVPELSAGRLFLPMGEEIIVSYDDLKGGWIRLDVDGAGNISPHTTFSDAVIPGATSMKAYRSASGTVGSVVVEDIDCSGAGPSSSSSPSSSSVSSAGVSVCGNFVLEAGEGCEVGVACASGLGCNVRTCRCVGIGSITNSNPTCGNFRVEPGEDCENGITLAVQPCTGTSTCNTQTCRCPTGAARHPRGTGGS